MTYEDHIQAIARAHQEKTRAWNEFRAVQKRYDDATERLKAAHVAYSAWIDEQINFAIAANPVPG